MNTLKLERKRKLLSRYVRVLCVIALIFGSLGCETLRERRTMSDDNANDGRPRSEQLRGEAKKAAIVSVAALLVSGIAVAIGVSEQNSDKDKELWYVAAGFSGLMSVVALYGSIALVSQADAASHRELEAEIEALRDRDKEASAIQTTVTRRFGLGEEPRLDLKAPVPE